MSKRFIILILTFLFAGASVCSGQIGRLRKPKLLRDGLALKGVQGNVVHCDANDLYFFEFDSQVSDDKVKIKSGTVIELLPSSTLEKMVSDMAKSQTQSCRLWATVTKYRDKNYMFPTNFWIIAEINEPEAFEPIEEQPFPPNEPQTVPPSELPKKRQEKEQQQKSAITVNDPNDTVTIPDDIMSKLRSRKVIKPPSPKKKPKPKPVVQKDKTSKHKENKIIVPVRTSGFKQDTVMADRTGFLVKDKETTNQKDAIKYDKFTFDALGFNVQISKLSSFYLLPCQILERAELKQSSQLEQIRFKVAGVVTQYKGNRYLLLQRATGSYSHGNFDY